jgi:hypothetical protein
MTRLLDRYEHFWKSGNYLLHKYKDGGDIVDHCLIYDISEDGHVRIEDMDDYTLGNDLIRRMAAEGVPVVRALPPSAGLLETIRMKLLEAGVRYEDFTRAFGELEQMKKKGCKPEDILRRLEEIIQARKGAAAQNLAG